MSRPVPLPDSKAHASRLPTVVVVNDEPFEQALLRRFLARQGMSSISLPLHNAVEAIVSMRPDLVLLADPGPGLRASFCGALKSRAPGVPVVLLVPGAETDLRAQTPDLDGAADVLQTPVDYLDLHRVLLPLLGGAAMRVPDKRVLVVDDDLDVLNLVTRVLGRAGCAVTCVSDPEQMLRSPPGDQFDLVLLDVLMPRIDGLEVCLVLRRHYGNELRICMMTAARDDEAVRIAEQFGADGYLLKPLRAADLITLAGVATHEPAQPGTALVPEPPRASQRTPAPALKKRVLVVDDDPDILAYCNEVFRRGGADVDVVSDPTTLAGPVPGGSYDLVLVDIFMPAFGGIDLIRHFLSDVRSVTSQFYAISARDDAELRETARSAGADGYLPKPLRARQLLSLLEDAGSAPLNAEVA
jgi:DNA-binding response OmpR family regulator